MRRCKLAPLASTSPETLDRVLLAARMLTVQPALEESPGRPFWPSPAMRRRVRLAAGRLRRRSAAAQPNPLVAVGSEINGSD